jgi:hypothetical protein
VTVGSAAIFFWARVVHAIVHVTGFSKFRTRTVVFSIAWGAFMTLAIELLRRAA